MKAWLKGLFSESSEVSFGRVMSFLSWAAATFWISWIVIKTNKLPDLIDAVVFMSPWYALTKGGQTMAAFFKSKLTKAGIDTQSLELQNKGPAG